MFCQLPLVLAVATLANARTVAVYSSPPETFEEAVNWAERAANTPDVNAGWEERFVVSHTVQRPDGLFMDVAVGDLAVSRSHWQVEKTTYTVTRNGDIVETDRLWVDADGERILQYRPLGAYVTLDLQTSADLMEFRRAINRGAIQDGLLLPGSTTIWGLLRDSVPVTRKLWRESDSGEEFLFLSAVDPHGSACSVAFDNKGLIRLLEVTLTRETIAHVANANVQRDFEQIIVRLSAERPQVPAPDVTWFRGVVNYEERVVDQPPRVSTATYTTVRRHGLGTMRSAAEAIPDGTLVLPALDDESGLLYEMRSGLRHVHYDREIVESIDSYLASANRGDASLTRTWDEVVESHLQPHESAQTAAVGESYCGLYSSYTWLRLLDRDVAFVDVCQTKYISDHSGSAISELQALFASYDIAITVITNMSMYDLARLRQPLILHVRNDVLMEAPNHYILCVGTDRSGVTAMSPGHGLLHLSYDELSLLWDGTALLDSTAAGVITNPWRRVVRTTAWTTMAGVALAGLSLIRKVGHRWASRPVTRVAVLISTGALSIYMLSVAHALVWPQGALTQIAAERLHTRGLSNDIQRVEVNELESRLESGAVVIDARPAEDVARGSIDGAIHLPTGIEAAEVRRRLRGIDGDRELVVLCQSNACGAADIVARRLIRMGYHRVRVLDGGWLAWQESLRDGTLP